MYRLRKRSSNWLHRRCDRVTLPRPLETTAGVCLQTLRVGGRWPGQHHRLIHDDESFLLGLCLGSLTRVGDASMKGSTRAVCQRDRRAEPARSKNVGGDRRHRSMRPARNSLAQRVHQLPSFAGRCAGGGAVPQGAGVPTGLLLAGVAVAACCLHRFKPPPPRGPPPASTASQETSVLGQRSPHARQWHATPRPTSASLPPARLSRGLCPAPFSPRTTS